MPRRLVALCRTLVAFVVIALVAVGGPGGLLSAVAFAAQAAASSVERQRPADRSPGAASEENDDAAGARAASDLAEDDEVPLVLPHFVGRAQGDPRPEASFGHTRLSGPSSGHGEPPTKPPRA